VVLKLAAVGADAFPHAGIGNRSELAGIVKVRQMRIVDICFMMILLHHELMLHLLATHAALFEAV
jgi:hypothetical protein